MAFMCKLATAWAPLIGRLCLAAIFVHSGLDKILNYAATENAMMARGVPGAAVLLVPAIAFELAGSLMLVLGWKARWGALLLIAFTVPATLYFHNFWDYPQAQFGSQLNHFLKNVAIVGALLMVLGLGSGPLSLDRPAQR